MKNLNLKRFSQTIKEFYTLNEFKEKLREGRPLNIKYGVDVTAPFLHIGHAVNLWKMRELQDIGHKVIFLIGDFTTAIGDPTDRNKTRPKIKKEEIERNAKEFIKQVTLVLRSDSNVFEIRRNSEWYKKMKAEEFISLLSMVTHSRLISRDMFRGRIRRGQDIYVHEMIYPVLQAYDSVMLNSDLTIVGTDQLFNEMVGRFYQERFGQEPQVVITTKITPGLDGKEKQSKSLGNYIALTDTPRDKFGKVMSIPDKLINDYLETYTGLEPDKTKEIKRLSPFEAKKELARAIVARYHGLGVADKEKEEFQSVFKRGNTPKDIKTIRLSKESESLVDLVVSSKLVKSKTEARRLIKDGAVEIDGKVKDDFQEIVDIRKGVVLKVGKHRFLKLIKGQDF